MSLGFDYVIVGAGSAGCVLAARLSENPDVRVALIEAGASDNATELQVPLLWMQSLKTKFDWDYASEPEPALGGRCIYVPRGKTLGGSSAINAMVYHRGHPTDYDEWAENGAAGWSHRDLLPYFIKSEGNERGDQQGHGRLGPLTVSDSRSAEPWFDRFIEAAVQAGHQRSDDFNGPSQMGVGRYQLTQRNGARCSAALAYLHPALARPNLRVFRNSLVQRIVFEANRATGVSIDCDGDEVLYADGEVIVSGGSYNSPQILMLSGIGPAAQLQALGLPVRADLPVGENLQDHPLAYVQYLTDAKTLLHAGTPENLALFQTERRGAFASNGVESGGFVSTLQNPSVPDIQLYFSPAMYDNAGLMQPHDDAFGIGFNLLKPTSRGRVTLRSARPDAKPRIFFNYYDTPEDRQAIRRGLEISLDIARQPALKELMRAPHAAPASNTPDDIWAHIQRTTGTVHHPTSTCAIGQVVDPDLKVFGIDRLRVVDASVMPSVVRGNTNAPVIAMAERAAELIAG
jgi:choline dehydrogenase-like flavoprotein